jgi:hypothetical protein
MGQMLAQIVRSSKHFGKKHLGLLAGLAMSIPVGCRGDTIIVTSLTDALAISGQTTFRGALQTANAAPGTDTIQFSPNLFSSGPAMLKMAGTEFPITNSVNIIGPGQSSLIIDAQQLSRIFDLSNSSTQVSISGMTLTNGLANNGNSGPGGSGGGIYNTASLSLQNVKMSNNRAPTGFIGTDTVTYGGGALYSLQANVTVQNCAFVTNSSNNNGGGVMTSGGTMNVTGSAFSGNSTFFNGAAIAGNDGASLTISNTTADNSINTRYFNTSPRASKLVITNSQLGPVNAFGNTTISNSTTGELDAYETVTVSNSTLGSVVTSSYINNGILNVNNSTLAQLNQQYGNATITNSTFKSAGAGNYAVSVGQGHGTTFLENDSIAGYQTSSGGTVYFPVGSNATVRNSTIARNQSSQGGGIVVATGILNMDSTIVADNTATVTANDLSGYVTGQNNLIGDPTGAFLLSANNLTGVDPLLGPLTDNGGPTWTMALLPGSPAIDTGSNLDNLLFDQRGFPRVSGPAADIGAYEFQVPEPGALPMLILILPFIARRCRNATLNG